MLLTFLRIDSTFIPVPDIASMALIEVADRSDMLTDPSLMFYLDVPQICLAWMLMNLQTMVSLVAENHDGINYRLFSMLVPVKTTIQRQGLGPHEYYQDNNDNGNQLNVGFSI